MTVSRAVRAVSPMQPAVLRRALPWRLTARRVLAISVVLRLPVQEMIEGTFKPEECPAALHDGATWDQVRAAARPPRAMRRATPAPRTQPTCPARLTPRSLCQRASCRHHSRACDVAGPVTSCAAAGKGRGGQTGGTLTARNGERRSRRRQPSPQLPECVWSPLLGAMPEPAPARIVAF